MMNKKIIGFFLALFALLFAKALFPSIQLMAFAPFFVILFIETSFIISMWTVFGAGLTVDLFSNAHFGQTALCYLLVCAFLYRQKRYFNDRPLSFALFAAFISLVATLLSYPLQAIFQEPPILSFSGCFSDLIIMPFIDGIYAIVWFFFPISLIETMIKLGKKVLSR